MGSGDIAKTKQKGERDYSDETLAHLNQAKLLINLWRALMSALDTEFKPAKKPQPQLTYMQRHKKKE